MRIFINREHSAVIISPNPEKAVDLLRKELAIPAETTITIDEIHTNAGLVITL
jgi:hypothetical protein